MQNRILVTKERCKSIEAAISTFREVFADVFSHHYCNLILKAWKQKDTAEGQKVLDGFKDLTDKRLPKGIANYSDVEIIDVLKNVYQGPGFDDEAAFLRAFYQFDHKAMSADAYFDVHKDKLSLADFNEVQEYLIALKKDNRELKEVGFVAVSDLKGNISGFVIYHLFEQNKQQILHIRQAAMLEQHKGYGNRIGCYLADKFPKAIYEANQRWANDVPMKRKMIEESLITKTPPVLGYSSKYIGLRGNGSLYKTALHKGLSRFGIKKIGNHYETDSIPDHFSSGGLMKKFRG